jgi:chromate transporter
VRERRSWKENWRESLAEARQYVRLWWASRPTPKREAEIDPRLLARDFLKLGATGFGGGIAVIAQVRRLVVRERRWLTEAEFLDAVSLAQSLPGANAANAITYVGLKLAGLPGAAVSVASFILPSFLMMIALTIAHDHLYQFPDAQRIFEGFNAAVVGLIVATTLRLGKTALQRQWHIELGVAVGFLLIFTDTSVAEVVLLAGLIGVFIRSFKVRARHRVRQRLRKKRQSLGRSAVAAEQARQQAAEVMAAPDPLAADHEVKTTIPPPPDEERPAAAQPETEAAEAAEVAEVANDEPTTPRLGALGVPVLLLLLLAWPFLEKFVTVWQLVTIFLRVGTVTFGGGFVMVPQIEADVVTVHRWLTHQAFADGMAFGQITPGPVLITATFIGYKVAGIFGAIASTIAAFLPSFIMTVIAGTSLNRFRTNTQVQAFLAGVAPAVVGMLAAAGVTLARSGLGTTLSYGVATLAFLLMMRARFNPVLIIFGCGLLQLILSRSLGN